MYGNGGENITGVESFLDAFVTSTDATLCSQLISFVNKLPVAFYNNIGEMTLADVAYVILNALMGRQFDAELLRDLSRRWVLPVAGEKSGMLTANAKNQINYSAEFEYGARFVALFLETLRRQGAIDSVYIINGGETEIAISVATALKPLMDFKTLTVLPLESCSEQQQQRLLAVETPAHVVYVKCDHRLLSRMLQRTIETCPVDLRERLLLVSATNVSMVPGLLLSYFNELRQARIQQEGEKPIIEYDINCGAEVCAVKLSSKLGLPVTFVEREVPVPTHPSQHLRVRYIPPTVKALTNSILQFIKR